MSIEKIAEIIKSCKEIECDNCKYEIKGLSFSECMAHRIQQILSSLASENGELREKLIKELKDWYSEPNWVEGDLPILADQILLLFESQKQKEIEVLKAEKAQKDMVIENLKSQLKEIERDKQEVAKDIFKELEEHNADWDGLGVNAYWTKIIKAKYGDTSETRELGINVQPFILNPNISMTKKGESK